MPAGTAIEGAIDGVGEGVGGRVSAIAPPGDAVHRRRWFTLATLCLSLVIIVMDNTILNVAIPRLVTDLGASNSQLQWIVDSYTIVFAGLLLTAGSLGDRFGRKRALTIGILLFALGSSLSALQSTASGLIFTRAFMGIGGALIMPSTLSILTNVFRDPKERARAIGVWAAFSGIGVAFGPMIGGLLLKHFSWSSVFWVNLPISALALTAGRFFVTESRNPHEGKLDPRGAVLSIVGLVALLFAIIEVPSKGWTSPDMAAALAIAVVFVGAFIAWELHTPNPMLDMRFYKNRRFSAANVAVTLTMFSLFGSLFLMTQYWQLVHSYTPLQVGVRLIPYALTMMIVAPLSARIVERFGTKLVMVTGLTIVGTSMLALSTLGVHSSYPRVILNLMANALGIGLTMAPATESIMGSLPRNKAGVGSAVNDTTRQVGGALGVAVIGSVVSSAYVHRLVDAARGVGLSGEQLATAKSGLGNALTVAHQLGEAGAGFVEGARAAFVGAFGDGLRIGSIVLYVAAALTLAFLPARAQASVEAGTAVDGGSDDGTAEGGAQGAADGGAEDERVAEDVDAELELLEEELDGDLVTEPAV
jgi:EmrB/QacA subfamily drug resistance transporter